MTKIIKVIIEKNGHYLFCLSKDNIWTYPTGILNEDEELSDAVIRIALNFTNINLIPGKILKKEKINKDQETYYFSTLIIQENNFIPNNFSQQLKWKKLNNFEEKNA